VEKTPKVSILIPTYNRRQTLERSIDSARSQSYPNISILVSDNASTDPTNEYLLSTDVKYISHASNCGGLANFDFLWGASSAPYKLFLADDDWIDKDYVLQCMNYIRDSGYSQVAGQALHYVNDSQVGSDTCFQLMQDLPLLRLYIFCNHIVTSNGVFYGVRQSSNYLWSQSKGSDYDDTYFSILNGKVAVIPNTSIHRDFSNWHQQSALPSEGVESSLTLGRESCSVHSLLAFFSVANAIRAYLHCDWPLALFFSFIASPELVACNVHAAWSYMIAQDSGFDLACNSVFENPAISLRVRQGLLTAFLALSEIAVKHPHGFAFPVQTLMRFSGLGKLDVFALFELWNDNVRSPDNRKLLDLRRYYLSADSISLFL